MALKDDSQLEQRIAELLEDEQYEGHPLKDALASLFQLYRDQLSQLERLTSISDGYHSALRERNETLSDRYRKQIRQLHKIVRISDHYQEMLRELNDALKVASTQDPLTGLANRRLMLERLNAEVATANRQRQPFSLALVDIDRFKQVNDLYGHDAGDIVMIGVSKTLKEKLRAYDISSRWGGEEFLVLLPETDEACALMIGERLVEHISELVFPELPEEVRVTVSIGVAEYELDTALMGTIKRADIAMYAAKSEGRNRAVRISDYDLQQD